MHIIFTKTYDDYIAGKDYANIERTLARRFVQMDVAIPMNVHLENEAEKAALAQMQTQKEKKKAADKLLADKDKGSDTAESKKATSRSKATKGYRR